MSRPFLHDSAFRYTEDGQSALHYLAAELELPVSNRMQRVYEHWSEDLTSVRRITTSGQGVRDLTARVRHDGSPESLEAFLAAGMRGAAIEYFPSLANPSLSFPCVLVDHDEIAPDPRLSWTFGASVRLRRTDGGTWQSLLEEPLFYWKAGMGTSGLSSSRAGDPSNAWYPDVDGIWKQAAAGASRLGWVAIDGVVRPTQLLGRAATNLILDSSDVDPDDANWDENAAWTQAAATALFEGGTSQLFTNDGATGSHSISQAVGTLVGDVRVLWWIVERDDVTVTQFGLRDATAGEWVVLGQYDWSTDTPTLVDFTGAAGTSGMGRIILSENGPNGGRVVLLYTYANATNVGNNATAILYPTSTGVNGESAIPHFCQYESGQYPTTPIVTAGSSLTRQLERWSADFPTRCQEMTVYYRWRGLGTRQDAIDAGAPRFYWIVGPGAPRVSLASLASGQLEFAHETGASFVSSTLSQSGGVDAVREALLQLRSDGSVQGHYRANEGSITSGAQSAANPLVPEWSDGVLNLNSTGADTPGTVEAEALYALPGILTMDEAAAA